MAKGASGLAVKAGGSADGGLSKVSLPELKGTPNQVKWANAIRQDFVNDYKTYINSDNINMGEGTFNPVSAEYIYTKFYERGLFNDISGSEFKANDYSFEQRDRVINQANSIYNNLYSQYKEKKAQGTIDKSLSKKAKEERARVYKKEIGKMLANYLEKPNATDAGNWIETYKKQYGKR